MPHFIEFNHYAIVNWSRFGIVLFCKTLHPNERRMNVDFKKLGDGPERISMCIHPDRQKFFLIAPSFLPCRNKLATAFFTFVALFALYKASFYVFIWFALFAFVHIYTALFFLFYHAWLFRKHSPFLRSKKDEFGSGKHIAEQQNSSSIGSVAREMLKHLEKCTSDWKSGT